MEQLNKYRSVIVLGVLFLFLLLFAFSMFGLQPTIDKMDSQKAEMVQIEEETALFQRKVNEMKGTGLTEEGSQADSLDALPQSNSEEQLVLDLRMVGAKSQAVLKNVDFNLSDTNEISLMTGSTENVYPFIKEVKMNAEVEGTYTQIYKWMNQLEHLPRLIKVDSFSFQQRSARIGQNSNGIVTANIVFTAYYEDIQGGAAVTDQ